MRDLFERVSASFNAQGLMHTLGAEMTHVAEGEVHIALLPRPELAQQDGYTHAGALTSVLDSACGYAAMTVAPAGHNVLTVEFKANFLRPALADRFLAVGKVRKAGKTLTVCEGELFGITGDAREVIAIMQATIINLAAR